MYWPVFSACLSPCLSRWVDLSLLVSLSCRGPTKRGILRRFRRLVSTAQQQQHINKYPLLPVRVITNGSTGFMRNFNGIHWFSWSGFCAVQLEIEFLARVRVGNTANLLTGCILHDVYFMQKTAGKYGIQLESKSTVSFLLEYSQLCTGCIL